MTDSHSGIPETRRRVGRPPKYSAEDAVLAALRLGIADFTMSDVARALGVTTPALYRRFPGRADLTDACFRHILADAPVAPADPSLSWREILEHTAEQYWRLFSLYPGLDRVIDSYPGLLREVWPGNEYLHQRLAPLGYSLPQVTFAAVHIAALTTAATARLRRRTTEFTRPADAAPPPRSFRASGTEITDLEELTEASHHQWRRCIDLFLDRLDALDPDWPEQPVVG
ncbi:MAG: helix-turn-helix domain-containing protein [Corynebacterium variabile]|uniref:TetR/AcrR family transcriptional regulator n=1 Tax=Corynebacterium variabile TaxID=1727 RepID=UPI003BB64AE4